MEELTLCMHGAADRAARFLQREQLTDPKQWAKFVDVFRSQPDGENYGWRGCQYYLEICREEALKLIRAIGGYFRRRICAET